MISRNIANHLDFDITIDIANKQYILKSKKDDLRRKRIIVTGFAITATNKNLDFIWPSYMSIIRNDNYTISIYGVNNRIQDISDIEIFEHQIKIIFDNYDSNTNIHLFGQVLEPEGDNINL